MVLPFRIRRREMRASRRMALRLAVFLAVVIGATFVYWQWQVHKALQAAAVDPVSIEQCEDLEETEALAQEGDATAENVDRQELQARLDACAQAGFEPEGE